MQMQTSGARRKGKKTYVNLDDLLHATSSSIQNSLDVITACLGLVANRALDQSSRGVCGDLTRDEDLAVCADGLGLCLLFSFFFLSSLVNWRFRVGVQKIGKNIRKDRQLFLKKNVS